MQIFSGILGCVSRRIDGYKTKASGNNANKMMILMETDISYMNVKADNKSENSKVCLQKDLQEKSYFRHHLMSEKS